MAITNLQQARQLYALGKRVRFRGGGMDAGRDDFSSPSADTGDQSVNDAVDTGDLGTETANVQANQDANMSSRERAIMNQYKNVPTPTITIGVDKFNNPITVPTTYTAKRNRQRAIDALNQKGISVFDPRVTKMFNPFDMSLVAQPKTKKFSFVRDVLVPVGLTAINPGLAAKYSKAKGLYNAAKFAADIAQTFGLTDTNLVDSFVSGLVDRTTSKSKSKTKSKTKSTKNLDDNINRDGEGLGSTPEMAALRDEYYLLLQKLKAGNILAGERNRLTALKNLLGFA